MNSFLKKITAIIGPLILLMVVVLSVADNTDLSVNYIFTNNANITANASETVSSLDNVKKLFVKTTTTISVNLWWNPVEKAKGYNVYKFIDNAYHKMGTTSDTSFEIKNLSTSTPYTFAVKAYNDNAESSNYTSLKISTNPPDVKISRFSANSNRINLYWNSVKGAQKYCIYKKQGSYWYKVGETGNISTALHNLDSATTYTLAVKAYNGIRYSTSFIQKSITTNPLKVSDFRGTHRTDTSVSLKWNSVKRASYYTINWKNGSKSYSKNVKSNSITINNLNPNTNYKFSVIACYTVGNQTLRSYEYTTTTVRTLLGTPHVIALSGVSKYNGVSLIWNVIKGANYYEVYQSTDNKNWHKVKNVSKANFSTSSVNSNKTYYYKVIARGNNIFSPYSNVCKCTVKGINWSANVQPVCQQINGVMYGETGCVTACTARETDTNRSNI